MTGPAVSVVCCWNDADVLAQCLKASIDREGLSDGSEIELVEVDNRGQCHRTAGRALNEGGARARGRWLVFCHQDVILHDPRHLVCTLDEIERAHGPALVGAVGCDDRGRILGSIRDRVVWIGEPAPTARRVATVDEVLFAIPRSLWQRHALSEDPRLAWHGYGVEYCMRLRQVGVPCVVADMRLTHNSATSNLAGLDVAHAHLAAQFSDSLPVPTTCGVIRPGRTSHRSARVRALLSGVGSRVRSATLGGLAGARVSGDDVRLVLDKTLAGLPGSGKQVLVLDLGRRLPGGDGLRTVTRCDVVLRFAATAGDGRARPSWSGESNALLVGTRPCELVRVARRHGSSVAAAGFHPHSGGWLLLVPRQPAPARLGSLPGHRA